MLSADLTVRGAWCFVTRPLLLPHLQRRGCCRSDSWTEATFVENVFQAEVLLSLHFFNIEPLRRSLGNVAVCLFLYMHYSINCPTMTLLMTASLTFQCFPYRAVTNISPYLFICFASLEECKPILYFETEPPLVLALTGQWWPSRCLFIGVSWCKRYLSRHCVQGCAV